MRALRRFFRRLGSWATAQQDEERLRAEIEDHLAFQTADNVRAGLSAAEARRQAVLKFGAVEAMKDDIETREDYRFWKRCYRMCARRCDACEWPRRSRSLRS